MSDDAAELDTEWKRGYAIGKKDMADHIIVSTASAAALRLQMEQLVKNRNELLLACSEAAERERTVNVRLVKSVSSFHSNLESHAEHGVPCSKCFAYCIACDVIRSMTNQRNP